MHGTHETPYTSTKLLASKSYIASEATIYFDRTNQQQRKIISSGARLLCRPLRPYHLAVVLNDEEIAILAQEIPSQKVSESVGEPKKHTIAMPKSVQFLSDVSRTNPFLLRMLSGIFRL